MNDILSGNFRNRIAGIYGFLVAVNIGAWVWAIIAFHAGMTLVDTTDGILMIGAYGWVFVKPIRKLYYNLTITFVSVVVALMSVESKQLVCLKNSSI
jgi:high-affinity nickel permease